MKHTIYRLLLAAVCMTGATQTQGQQISVGPELGFTASGVYYSQDELYAGLNGHIGATAHLQFGRFFAIRPSLLYKFGSLSDPDDREYKFSFNRISLPVPLLFSYVFDNSSNLFVGAGPSLMYSLSGKAYMPGSQTNLSFGRNIGQIKPLDVGVHLKGGFRFPGGFALSAFANFGVTNLDNRSDYTFKSMDAIGLSFGYMFGGRNDY
ncbi:MAG: PorT family protein [Chitinophagaceae bacterium]|nr:PorT family protein [Chitinophagaceae bacterium]MCW5926082.1 PorT family protein [Chitinophagaceae bacterium]